MEEKSPSKGASSTKMARNKSLPSKFQKLLASKFNEGFQSVFTTTGRSGSQAAKKDNSATKTGEIVINDDQAEEKEEDQATKDPNNATPKDSADYLGYNKISHRKKQGMLDEANTAYGRPMFGAKPLAQSRDRMIFDEQRASGNMTNYTFFSRDGRSPSYQGDSIIYKSKLHL